MLLLLVFALPILTFCVLLWTCWTRGASSCRGATWGSSTATQRSLLSLGGSWLLFVCSFCFTAHLASREEHVVLWIVGVGSARRQSNKEKEKTNRRKEHYICLLYKCVSFQLQEWYEKGKSIASGEVVEFTKWKQETVNLVRVAQQYFDGFVSGALKVTLLLSVCDSRFCEQTTNRGLWLPRGTTPTLKSLSRRPSASSRCSWSCCKAWDSQTERASSPCSKKAEETPTRSSRDWSVEQTQQNKHLTQFLSERDLVECLSHLDMGRKGPELLGLCSGCFRHRRGGEELPRSLAAHKTRRCKNKTPKSEKTI